MYLLRWQLSTPILSGALVVLSGIPVLWGTVVANLVGGLIFFWVDRFIFRKTSKLPQWEIVEIAECAECGREARCYRIVSWGKYDRTNDSNPQYRCRDCSLGKMDKVEKIK